MSESPAVSLEFPEPDIALLTLDVAGRSANMLSHSLLVELGSQLDVLEQRSNIAGIIIASAKRNSFVVGADLQELRDSLDMIRQEVLAFFQTGKDLFQRFASIKAVTVAAIHGACVGGGAELAIWCDLRVLSDSPRTCIGFPEVKLGLIPGWGGTVRLPRLIGLADAATMIIDGSSISADAALQSGLADAVFPEGELIQRAIDLIRQQQDSAQYLSQREARTGAMPEDPQALQTVMQKHAWLQQHAVAADSHANETALRLMLETGGNDVQTALQRESDAIALLFGSEANRAMLNLFFLQDRVRKDTGLNEVELTPAQIDSAGAAGAGLMGQQIARTNIDSGIPFTLFDIDESMLDSARKSFSDQDSESPAFNTTTDLEDLAHCDLVIETIVEKEGIKKEFLPRLESNLDAGAVLGSNTSTISIDKLAEGLKHPQRFCGIHFAHPIAQRKIVEIIRGAKTSDQTVATAFAYGKRIGKIPIVVEDSPGFVLNRILFSYVNESLKLMAEGASIREIDAAAVEFGMPYGPFSHFDQVGLDTAAYAGTTMYMAYYHRIPTTPILPKLVKKKRLGMKSGRGFYSYENDQQIAQDDPTLLDVVGQYIDDPPRSFSRDELQLRLFLPMLVEATMILEENLVRFPGAIDLSLVFGLGFPKSKGGILFWADRLGAKQVLEMLKPLEKIGPRYQPTRLMKRMAEQNACYY